MLKWQTVLPLPNLTLPDGQQVQFAAGVVLGPNPDWVPKETMLKDCGKWDRVSAETATAALVADYEAPSFGEPDPDWKGTKPRSIQDRKYELCLLANLALWIARPTPAGFRVLLHGRMVGAMMMAQHVECGFTSLVCLEQEVKNQLTANDLQVAAQVHASLVSVDRKGSIWVAARSVWVSLHVSREDVRYLFFWVALEALFGPESSTGEITHKIAERLAFFLEGDRAQAKELFKSIKKAYGYRSKIAHGDSGGGEESLARMAEVESWVRRALLKILMDTALVAKFSGNGRDEFLADLVFQA